MNAHAQQQQLQQAMQLLQNNQFAEAKNLLQVLANQGNPNAHFELATVLLMQPAENLESANDLSAHTNSAMPTKATDKRQFFENPVIDDIRLGMYHLLQAEKLGYPPAVYRLAYTSLTETAEPLNWNTLAERMAFCCRAGHPNALCDAAIYFGRYGNTAQQLASTNMLELAALNGSIVAMALLGERLASGRYCHADPGRANSILALARDWNMPVCAPDLRFGFSAPEPSIAPVMGTNIDFDFSQLQQCEQLPLGKTLHSANSLHVYNNALSKEECLYIQCLGAPNLEPSIVVDDNGKSHLSAERSSHDFYFLPEFEQVYLNILQRKMAKAAKLPIANSEQLTMLRYLPGQEFRMHRDNLPSNHFISIENGGSGQRSRTVIAYLEAPISGGKTHFPLLSLELTPEQGQIICFDNLLDDGKLCAASLHAGTPVKQGVKWICTLWMRQNTHRTL
jgi:prolyl 4-hydroxylase